MEKDMEKEISAATSYFVQILMNRIKILEKRCLDTQNDLNFYKKEKGKEVEVLYPHIFDGLTKHIKDLENNILSTFRNFPRSKH